MDVEVRVDEPLEAWEAVILQMDHSALPRRQALGSKEDGKREKKRKLENERNQGNKSNKRNERKKGKETKETKEKRKRNE